MDVLIFHLIRDTKQNKVTQDTNTIGQYAFGFPTLFMSFPCNPFQSLQNYTLFI